MQWILWQNRVLSKKIGKKIQKIGGVLSPGSPAFWMYDGGMPSSSGGGLEAANNLSSQHIRCSAYKMKDENKMLKACRILYYWNQFILALSVALISLPWHLLVLKFSFQLSVVVNTMHYVFCETDLRRGVKMSQGCNGMAQHVVILLSLPDTHSGCFNTLGKCILVEGLIAKLCHSIFQGRLPYIHPVVDCRRR